MSWPCRGSDGAPSRTESRSPRTALRSRGDRKSTRLNSSHGYISYAGFCLKKKNVELEATPSDPPPVHQAIGTPAPPAPQQRQVSDDVGRPQDAIDTRPFQRDHQPSQQRAA